MLSPAALEYRRGKVTASDARTIMNASADADMLHLFNVKIGAEEPEPENYAMRCGVVMEPLIIAEYERVNSVTVMRRQEVVDHPTINNFMCTLDGYLPELRRVVEVKFASPFMSRDEIFRFYYPQVAFQMSCCDAADGVMVVGQGTNDPVEIECVRDLNYETELLSRCEAFLLCVKTLVPPCTLPVVVPPERWRTIDLDIDKPNWAEELECLLFVYSTSKPYVDQCEEAGKLARSLIPDDVGKVIASGYTINRNKRGVLSILKRAA